MRTHLAVSSILLIQATGLAWAAGAAEIRIRISYHESVVEVRPVPSSYVTRQTILVTLHDNHFASEHREWQSGSQHGTVDSDSAFGSPVKAGAYDVDWHVGGRNSLVREKVAAQHVETLVVRVSGHSCTATIRQRLKPGFSEFVRYGSANDAHYSSSITTVVDGCEIE